MIEIRVGICSCTCTYQGLFEGKEFEISGERFRLKEVLIKDTFPRRYLSKKRCHFFLDVHQLAPRGFDTFLGANCLITDNKGKHLFKFSGAGKWQRYMSEPANIEYLFEEIKELTAGIPSQTIQAWNTKAAQFD